MSLLLLTGLFATQSHGQHAALKSNLAMDALASVNAGVELGLSRRVTLDLSGQYNGWTVRGYKWKHWLAQPEARYWFCDRFSGHFLGLHALGGQYNVGHIPNHVRFLGSDFGRLSDHRVQGWAAGGGLSYGYAWVLGRHWNFEAELGVGYAYTRYDVFECAGCGRRTSSDRAHHYVGPTKAALSLVYVF